MTCTIGGSVGAALAFAVSASERGERNGGPDVVRAALDRRPVPAQRALCLAVGSDDERDEQQGRQRPREKEGVATNASQHRAGERVAGRDRGERDVCSGGGEHG